MDLGGMPSPRHGTAMPAKGVRHGNVINCGKLNGNSGLEKPAKLAPANFPHRF
jgi:hypothetical protein